ncbi:unnamed protein product [Allacma fusca]|uniref:Uncharacterized protein n=1 Tax=Allacma fusca TaxID=39272 RepID=A0A8J2KYX6_9HEXA|nr:unnamed protein product [Allacma fusca]
MLKAKVITLILLVTISGINCQYIRPIQDTWPWVSYTSSTSRPSTTTTMSSTRPAESTVAPRIRPTLAPAAPEVTFSPESDIEDDYVRVIDMKTNREYWIPRDRFWKIFGNQTRRPTRNISMPQSGSRSTRGAYSVYSPPINQPTGYSGSSSGYRPSVSPCKSGTSTSGYGWHYLCVVPISPNPCTSTNCRTNKHHHHGHSCGSHRHNTSPPVTSKPPTYPVGSSTTKSNVIPYVPGRTPSRRPTVYPSTWRPTTLVTTSTEKQTTPVSQPPKESTSTTVTSKATTSTTPPTTSTTTEAQYPDEDWDLGVTPVR